MKYLKYTLLLPILLVIACEDVITVELDEADPIFVVDAWINNLSENQEIRLSWSKPYFDSLTRTPISEAEVMVTNANGDNFEFVHINDGLFRLDPNSPRIDEIDMTWNLEIIHNNITYTSTTVQNDVPPIDSIVQEFRENEVFADDGIFCTFISRDLRGVGDTYWIKSFKNDMFLNRPQEINIAFDGGLDAGPDFDELIFIQPIKELINESDENFVPIAWEPGESIRVEIHSMSQAAYSYMEILRDQLLNSNNGIFAEPLANTRGNVTSSSGDEVLGIFNVASVSTLSDTIR